MGCLLCPPVSLVSPWLLYTGNKAFQGDCPRLLTLLQFYYQPRLFFDSLCQSVFYEGFEETSHFLLEKARRSFRRWRSAVFSCCTTSIIFFSSSVNSIAFFFSGFICGKKRTS